MLQQVDTTLDRSQLIALRPECTFVQRKSLMSIIMWSKVVVFANNRKQCISTWNWAFEWRNKSKSDVCKALDCKAAIVQSKLIVDYEELDRYWKAVFIYLNCDVARRRPMLPLSPWRCFNSFIASSCLLTLCLCMSIYISATLAELVLLDIFCCPTLCSSPVVTLEWFYIMQSHLVMKSNPTGYS